jgi:hypothetical protein
LEVTVSAVDYVEVSRTAHQLSKDHGRNAAQYAAKLAREALAEGKSDEFATVAFGSTSVVQAITDHLRQYPAKCGLLPYKA